MRQFFFIGKCYGWFVKGAGGGGIGYPKLNFSIQIKFYKKV